MDPILGVGVGTPFSSPSAGWDWWSLAGAAVVAIVLVRARFLPIAVSLGLALLAGLVVGSSTEAFGIVPVWSVVVLASIAVRLRRRRPS